MIKKIISTALIGILLILTASCGAAPDHEYMDDIPEILPLIPAENTFIFQGDEYSIAVNVETMLPYHFFSYSEGAFQVCYDAGSHSDHSSSCQNVGFTDIHGNVIIPLEYRLGDSFSGGLVALMNRNYRYGYADLSGEIVIPFEYTQATSLNEDRLAIVGKSNDDNTSAVHGIINKDGEYIMPLGSYGLNFASNGLLHAVESLPAGNPNTVKFGMIDIHGNVIIPFLYDSIGMTFSEDLVYVLNFGQPYPNYQVKEYGFYDSLGNPVIPAELNYNYIGNFYEGLAYVMSTTSNHVLIDEYGYGHPATILYGYIDKTGELAIPMNYNEAQRFIDGVALVGIYKDLDGESGTMLYGFIDKDGNAVVPIVYANAKEFSGGLAAVSTETDSGIKYGYVNKTGEIVIPFVYDAADLFSSGFAIVEQNGLRGMIDSDGNAAIPLLYENCKVVSEELAAVRSENLWGLTDFSGNIVLTHSLDSVDTFSHGIAVAQKDGKYGIITANGETAVPFEYDEIQRFGDFIVVKSDGLRGIWHIIPNTAN